MSGSSKTSRPPGGRTTHWSALKSVWLVHFWVSCWRLTHFWRDVVLWNLPQPRRGRGPEALDTRLEFVQKQLDVLTTEYLLTKRTTKYLANHRRHSQTKLRAQATAAVPLCDGAAAASAVLPARRPAHAEHAGPRATESGRSVARKLLQYRR